MEVQSESDRSPHRVDLHVGARIRMRRKIMGVTQEQLAEALHLTFQQVQKYERGSNRVSASKLYEMAKFLNVPMSYFFDGLADPAQGTAPAFDRSKQVVHDFLMTPESLEMSAAFPRIASPSVRRGLLDLIARLADSPRATC